jgi:ferric-dicitrate binding protein FerR (iron transport regulator)
MKEDQNKSTLWEAFWHDHLDDDQIKELRNLSDEAFETELKHRWDKYYSKNSIFSIRERRNIINQILIKGSTEKQKRPNIFYFVAASLAILILGYFALFAPEKVDSTVKMEKSIDLNPGENKAVLTLSNGKKISLGSLGNGLLTEDGQAKIYTSEKGALTYIAATETQQILTNNITTPRGGQYKLTLADGTNIWLNAASSLTYPSSFQKGKPRIVELSGEGFFEVRHNAQEPFIVHYGNGLEAVVLGTSFNINTYADEKATYTTLVKGSLSVQSPQEKKDILTPGQQSVFIQGKTSIISADIEETVAWKEGWFLFNRLELQAIVRQLSRWYNIDFDITGTIGNKQFSGIVSKSNNISEVLKIMENTGVTFTLRNQKIYVSQ